jgi:hypothetical protein
MREVCFLWLLAVMPVVLCAQTKLTDESRMHPISIRANLPGLLDVFDGNLSVGIEYGAGRRGALIADLGLIFYSVYNNNSSRSLGFHFKPAYRYYFTDRRRGFVDAGLLFKRVGYNRSEWLDKGIVNGIATYQEFQNFTHRKNVLGVQLMGGYKVPLNKQGNLWLEFYGGLSARLRWHSIKGMPDAAFRRGFDIFDNDPWERSVWPGVPGGMRLTFRVD